MLWVMASRKDFRFQRYALSDGYTLVRQSMAPLPNFTYFLREDGLKTSILDIILRAPRLRQSLFSVCFA